jgi:hypothetical protein
MDIKKGTIREPYRVVLYGQEGVGKTTLASQFPNPLFIDVEQSTGKLDVYRTPAPNSWPGLIQQIGQLQSENVEGFQTLVIDTLDWAQRLCINHVCASRMKQDGKPVDSIESFGYGRGYTYIAEEMGRLLDALSAFQSAMGWHVVLVCHATLRKFELPEEEGSFDRWEMKIERRPQGGISAQSLVKEWANLMLFAAYATIVVTGDTGKRKASGEKRVLRTSHTAVWDAKNRDGLKPEIPLEWASIAHLFSDAKPAARPARVDAPAKTATSKSKPPAPAPANGIMGKLRTLMQAEGLCDDDIQRAVHFKGHYPLDTPIENYDNKFVEGWIMAHWPKVSELAKGLKNG